MHIKNTNILLLITVGLIHITNINTQASIDDNYVQIVDTNIPQPTNIQITPQKFATVEEVTVPIIINPPKMIHPAYNIKLQNDGQNNCWVQDLPVVKKFGDYIKFQKDQLGKFQQWPVEIIDGTYSITQKKVYAMLTNGSLLVANLSNIVAAPNKITNFKIYDFTITSKKQIWQLNQYELYATSSKLYFIRQQKLYSIIFIQDSKWTMQIVQGGLNIKSVVTDGDSIYLIKNDGIHGLLQVQKKVSLKSLVDFSNYTTNNSSSKMQIVDASIDNGFMYALCRVNGIFLIKVNNNFQIVDNYKIDFSQFAHQINAKSGTVLVNYKLYRKNFIAEFFFNGLELSNTKPLLKLNKFYYRFGQMNQIVMFQSYAIIYSLSQMNVFQHSLNRNLPFSQQQTQLLYRAYFPKILNVIPLTKNSVQFVLIQKNGVFVQSFGNSSVGIIQSQLHCLYFQTGQFNVSVQFQGPCSSPSNTTHSYCTKKNNYLFDVNNYKAMRLTQKYNNHAFLILILLVIFVLVLGGIMTYRRITEQRRQQLRLLLQRRRASVNQMISRNGQEMVSNSSDKNKQLVLQEKQFQR